MLYEVAKPVPIPTGAHVKPIATPRKNSKHIYTVQISY